MFGRALVEALRAEASGIEAGMNVVPGERTSYSIVICPPGVDRMFLHCPGANDTFGADDVNPKIVADARLFHFGYPPLMARTYANGAKDLMKILQIAKAAGATTSLDMAYPDPSGPAAAADWPAILNSVLPLVDIFTPSVEELTFLLRRKTFERLIAQAGEGEMLSVIDGRLLDGLAEQCLAAGAGIVLIKCGRLGAYVRTAGRGRLEQFGRATCVPPDDWANRELLEPSYRVEPVVSANGAGDCAIAGFLAALLRGLPIADCLRCACAAGWQNLQAADAISGISDWASLMRFVEGRPEKVDVDIPLERWRFDRRADQYVGPRDRAP